MADERNWGYKRKKHDPISPTHEPLGYRHVVPLHEGIIEGDWLDEAAHITPELYRSLYPLAFDAYYLKEESEMTTEKGKWFLAFIQQGGDEDTPPTNYTEPELVWGEDIDHVTRKMILKHAGTLQVIDEGAVVVFTMGTQTTEV